MDILNSLQQEHPSVREEYYEYVREIKEKMCTVAEDYNLQISQRDYLNEEQRSYELPDDQVIQVDHRVRFKATEILFQPSLCGSMAPGIAKMTFDSIEKCDNDLKINLYNNIVLAGGTTLLPGFQERFEYEIKSLAMHAAKTDIMVYADLQRKFSAWIGGSMLASFSNFPEMTIKKEEYENAQEHKDQIVLKKSIY